jgi:hypothetical protein
MEAFALDDPRLPAVAAYAEPDSSRCDDDLGTRRVSAHLVDITIDFNGRLPRGPAVS